MLFTLTTVSAGTAFAAVAVDGLLWLAPISLSVALVVVTAVVVGRKGGSDPTEVGLELVGAASSGIPRCGHVDRRAPSTARLGASPSDAAIRSGAGDMVASTG